MKVLSHFLCENGDEKTGRILMHWCPGCNGWHMIPIEKRNHLGAVWGWDGDVEKPTVSPSVNIVGVCHYFLSEGVIEFCGDSRHALSGQKVPLPKIPERLRNMIFED